MTEKLLEFVDRQGIPVAMLVFGIMAIVYLWRWFGREIILPLRDRFISRMSQFIDRLEASLGQVHTKQEASEKARGHQTEILEVMQTQMKEVREACMRMEIKLGTAHQFKARQTKIQTGDDPVTS